MLPTHLDSAAKLKDWLASREDSTKIQEGGAEDKRKTYRCVVWLAKAITPADLEPLTKIKDMIIDQTTPIRVLHRSRKIFWTMGPFG